MSLPPRLRPRRGSLRPPPRGIPLRAIAPNAMTALALCSGLSGIRYAIEAQWERSVLFVILAAVLDGLDGRVARLLRGASRFGAELDSLSDVVAFGVSPGLILYLWSLQHLRPIGWVCALALAVCCALRLARFNANIDVEDQPHKRAGFLTGVPAPAGAGIALLPLLLWLSTGYEIFRQPYIVAPWAAFTAFLMVSNLATFSWASLRIRRSVRLSALVVIVLIGAILISAPWPALSTLMAGYVLSIPFSILSYTGALRRRGSATTAPPPAAGPEAVAPPPPLP